MTGELLVTLDPESERVCAALAEQIAKEISARLAAGDRIDTKEAIAKLAELIADSVLDDFVVRERTDATPRYKWQA